MKPEISVVIPVYNTSKYLCQCLESVRNQSFKNIEMVCIDDGSTDDSLMILNHLAEKDDRIKVIHRERSSGSAAVPRNMGLKEAKGKYIIFLDSDDYFDLDLLEKMYSRAVKTEAELVMCDNYIVSEEGKIKDIESDLHHKYLPDYECFSYKDIPGKIYQISNAAVWHKLILVDVINRNELLFQENLPILDDVYFVNLLLVLVKRISICDEKLIYYRQFREGAQTSGIEKNIDSIYIAFKQLYIYLHKSGIYAEISNSLHNWTLDMMLWWYYSIKDRKIAETLYQRYKQEYFAAFGLDAMNDGEIMEDKKAFWCYVMQEEYKPSIGVMLNEINPSGARIVLYGAGKLGMDAYEYIENGQIHSVVLWCDKNPCKGRKMQISPPKEIVGCKYDAIIIAIGNAEIVREVKDYLVSLGVEEHKIQSL